MRRRGGAEVPAIRKAAEGPPGRMRQHTETGARAPACAQEGCARCGQGAPACGLRPGTAVMRRPSGQGAAAAGGRAAAALLRLPAAAHADDRTARAPPHQHRPHLNRAPPAPAPCLQPTPSSLQSRCPGRRDAGPAGCAGCAAPRRRLVRRRHGQRLRGAAGRKGGAAGGGGGGRAAGTRGRVGSWWAGVGATDGRLGER